MLCTKRRVQLSNKEYKDSRASLQDWVKAISALSLVGIITYKIYVTPIELTVDFPTLLSLLLALFSVALAALFYFKATETSSTFYDNTYNFTKDIAQLLVKIESGFGERLKNLDEGYSSMRNYLQNPTYSKEELDDTKQKIEGEKQEIEKVVEERNSIVSDLIEKAQIEQGEKEKVRSLLAEKEKDLENSQRELSRMKKKLFSERIRNRESKRNIESGFEKFTYTFIVEKIEPSRVERLSYSGLRRRIDSLLNEAPQAYINDLKKYGFFDNGVTLGGINFIKEVAVKYA